MYKHIKAFWELHTVIFSYAYSDAPQCEFLLIA